MSAIFISIFIMSFGGVAALCAGKRGHLTSVLGAVSVVVGCIVGVIPAIRILFSSEVVSFNAAWSIPYGSFSLGLDSISALFLVPVFFLSALAAIYGVGYLKGHGDNRAIGTHWFFYSLLVVSMIVVVLARNGMLFLFAWEIMALSSYFLVTHDDSRERVRVAGWTYLIATHIGTIFLLVFFAIMAREMGTLDFDGWVLAKIMPNTVTGLLFLCILVGFGTKAGFMPLHVWLPVAHPAAPSHVSALMSGVMLGTGIYGIVRFAMFFGKPPLWWGELLLIIGALSGIFGILYALTQGELKTLLAYSSVENIGVIALGLGMGFLGMAINSPLVALLGFSGSFLHVINHAFFKGLLFLSAGAVLRASGTGAIDKQGGLLGRMPYTGASFFIGSISASGLPPLGGFMGEFLIFMSALAFMSFRSKVMGVDLLDFWPAIMIIVSLAMIGASATACFVKAFGVVFLGVPRSQRTDSAREVRPSMCFAMFALAAICVFLSFAAPVILDALWNVLREVTGFPVPLIGASLTTMRGYLVSIVVSFAVLLFITLGLLAARQRLFARREVRLVPTWDCGYASPNPRMQYTGSSFVDPAMVFFHVPLCIQENSDPVQGFFPRRASFNRHPHDFFREMIYAPAFRFVERALSFLRWLQHGNVNIYVLYIAFTLIVLLIWKFGVL